MNAPSSAAVWAADDIVDGRYRVVGELGRGGMGVVHRVRHLAWGIDMAVKSPRPDLFGGPGDQELFVREAEAWVSLGLHPNVCACHYVRVVEGTPRVFAEFVEGGSLAEWIRDGRLYAGDARQALGRVLDTAVQMARGLEHSHGRGLVHQDVKPANVLLDGDGTAKITDFGLARSKGAVVPREAESAPGVSVLVPWGGMTVTYASPEQLAGGSVGRRSDVYSFAVSLLEMITGRACWSAGSVAGLALAEYLGAAANPVAAPPELANLLRRCLRQSAGHRPPSMADIADVLTGIYEQETGSAYPRPTPKAADLRADELNNRGLSLLDLDRVADAGQAFTEALSVDPHHVGAVYNAGLLSWRTGTITDVELVGRLEALPQDTESSWQTRLHIARVHLERGDVVTARELLDVLGRERPGDAEIRAATRAAADGSATDARRIETRALGEPFRLTPPVDLLARHVVAGHLPIRFSPDGRLALSGHWDGGLRLWDTATGASRPALMNGGTELIGVDLTPDGSYALSVEQGGTVRWWDVDARRCERAVPAAAAPRGCPVRLSADARIGVWIGADGHVQVWEPRTGTCRWSLGVAVEGSLDGSRYEVSPDGRHVLTGEEDGARLWSVADGRCRALPAGSPSSALCFGPDGRLAAVASDDGTVRVWDVEDGRLVRTLTGSTTAALHLALGPGGRRLLSGSSADHTVRVWDVDSGRCLRTFSAGRHGMRHLGFPDADDRFGFSVGNHPDLHTRRWRLPDGGCAAEPHVVKPREYAEISGLSGQAEDLLAEARREMTGGRHRSALGLLTRARAIPGYERAPQVLAAWRELGRSTRHVSLRAAWSRPLDAGPLPYGSVTGIGLAAHARLAVSGQSDGTLRVWDLDSGECTRAIEDHPSRAAEVALSDDGRYLLCYGTRPHAITRRQLDGDGRRQVSPHWDLTRTVLFTGDGRHALLGGREGTVRRWDLEEDRCVSAIGPAGPVNVISPSPDGRLAAIGDCTGVVGLWDLVAGRNLRTWKGPREPILSACLSADGRLALSTHMVTSSGAGDEPIRLWDAASEHCVREFVGHVGWVSAVRFTPDARFAFSAGHDRTVRMWDVASGRCLHVLEGHREYVRHLEITPDLRNLVTAGDDGLRLWQLDWELAADGV
ncbi:protein kinase domain-containing protein [Streptomyces xanthii]|uniref:Protein kinase n=1 Tax=Streptomyces xanthii TaxID=2768069 RepID=A0A7H1BHH3_9ACTN|nr:protein kinase [Streptomyces xanthii]QNS08178.1 protein kinase [Streptomyces xanthii]